MKVVGRTVRDGVLTEEEIVKIVEKYRHAASTMTPRCVSFLIPAC